jgi:hypothetical protein
MSTGTGSVRQTAPVAKVCEIALMAAIVTTLVYVPVGALVAVLAFGAFGVPLHSLLSFGGDIHIVAGLALWWGIAFVPASVYAAVCLMS